MGWSPSSSQGLHSTRSEVLLFLLLWYLSLSWIIPIRKENTHEKFPFSHIPWLQPHLPVPHRTQISRILLCPLPKPLPSWHHWNDPSRGPQWLPKCNGCVFVLIFFDLTIPSSWTLAWLPGQLSAGFFPSSLPASICLACSIQLHVLGQLEGFVSASVILYLCSPWVISSVPRDWYSLFMLLTPKFLPTETSPVQDWLTELPAILASPWSVSQGCLTANQYKTRADLHFWAFEN